jgi:hypothetical protein
MAKVGDVENPALPGSMKRLRRPVSSLMVDAHRFLHAGACGAALLSGQLRTFRKKPRWADDRLELIASVENLTPAIFNAHSGPCTHKPGSCPLQSESDRITAQQRNDALCQIADIAISYSITSSAVASSSGGTVTGSTALSANRASLAEVHVCVAPMSHHMKTEFANKSLRPPIETDFPS